MTRTLDVTGLSALLQAAAIGWGAHKDELRNLDAALGDGDMGVTAELGSRALLTYLATTDASDVSALMIEGGRCLNRACPSTFGTLLASAFVRAGKSVVGRTKVGTDDLLLLGRGAIDGIRAGGHAEPGDKTMIDALAPAVDAFEQAVRDCADDTAAVEAALQAARRGMEATRLMPAKHGRASYRQDGGIGVQDAGATAMWYLVESFGMGLIEAPSEEDTSAGPSAAGHG